LPRPVVAELVAAGATGPESAPNHLQHDLLTLARSLGLPVGFAHIESIAPAATEGDAAAEVRAHLDALAAMGPLAGDA